MADIPTYLTVRQFASKHPAFSQNSLRFQIFNRKENGMDKLKVIVKMGAKVLIDEAAFFQWLRAEGRV